MGEAGLSAPVLVGGAFALGACVGSFLNVVVWRLPRGESIVWPGSRCPKCRTAIPGWANVPVLSWLALRGRCRSCSAPISARYPIVEALTGLLFAGLFVVHGPSARLVVEWALAAALVAVTFIDLDHHIIPNEITLPGVAAGLVISFVAPSLGVPWRDAVLGVLCVAGMLWLVSWSYERFAGKVGLGMGDVKLVAMLASFLGLEAALGILVLGSLVGLAYGVAMIAWLRTGRATRIPFGPALALAGIAFLFQPDLMQRVLGPE